MICKKCGEEKDDNCFAWREKNVKRRERCRVCQNKKIRDTYREKRGGKLAIEVRAEIREADPKPCFVCGVIKPLSDFKLIHNTKRHFSFCHECGKQKYKDYHNSPEGKAKAKAWYDANQDKIAEYREKYRESPKYIFDKKAYHRKRTLRIEYGLTVEAYNSMLESQNMCCAICGNGRPSVSGKRSSFLVDHDHVTGKNRGLLCHNCNVSLGLMKDSPVILRKAAEYLESHKI